MSKVKYELKSKKEGKSGKELRRNTYTTAKTLAKQQGKRTNVTMNVKNSKGVAVTDRSEITWNSSVFGKRGDKWQLHTTGSHNNKELYFSSENNGWNFIVRDWPKVESQWKNSKVKDGEGNTIIIKNNKILNWG